MPVTIQTRRPPRDIGRARPTTPSASKEAVVCALRQGRAGQALHLEKNAEGIRVPAFPSPARAVDRGVAIRVAVRLVHTCGQQELGNIRTTLETAQPTHPEPRRQMHGCTGHVVLVSDQRRRH